MTSTDFASWNGEQRTQWCAGDWSLLQRGDEIADITFAGIPVLRALRFVIRDRDWRTPEAQIRSVTMLEDTVGISAGYVLDDIDVTAHLWVAASDDQLTVSVDATAASAFWTQRTGLVAQQPPHLADSDLTVIHPDGSRTATFFPNAVRPHQPAIGIAELRWRSGALPLRMRFEGGVFEMEDQRNWTDASYKSYTPPLSAPAPVQTTPGQTWRQSIIISATRTEAAAAPTSPGTERIELVRTARVAPAIGVQASTAPEDSKPHPAPPAQFVLVELDADAANWSSALERAAAAAARLDVRIITDNASSVASVVAALKSLDVVRIGVVAASTHVTEAGLWNALVEAVRTAELKVELVGGTRAHYTELNRNHHRMPSLPAYTFSITPQMHVHETAQLVESLPMQHLVARDANWITAGAPLHVGPVTLRAHVNAVATTPPAPERHDLSDGYGPNHVPGASDPRQTEPAISTWTIASAAALSAAGATSITYFEAWGPRGVEAADGTPYPVRAAVQALTELAGSPLLVQTGISANTRVWGIGVERDEDRVVLVANLTATKREVHLTAADANVHVAVPAWGWRVVAV